MPWDQETIMVVEDDCSMRHLLADMLQTTGGRAPNILSFASAGEAQAYLQEAGGTDGIVICDIAMPGLNGLELYVNVHEEHPGLKFLFITALKLLRSEHRLLEEGGLRVLTKPFGSAELLAAIEDLSGEG